MKQQLVLTPGQEVGFQLFTQLYTDPNNHVMLLKGYSGTGKTTLVTKFLSSLSELDQMLSLINPAWKPLEVFLTATTHQAAEAFSAATGNTHPTCTIHSLIGAVVKRDYMTGKTELVLKQNAEKVVNALIVVDEASYADQVLLSMIFKQTENCKIVFMGDHAQFTPIGSSYMPAFNLNYLSHELTEVMRQRPGPLYELCMGLRSTVLDGIWPTIQPDGDQLQHVAPDKFMEMILEAFQNPDKWGNCKVLAYTNDQVIKINNWLSQEILGSKEPRQGQRMLVNTAVNNRHAQCSTGEEVFIEEIREESKFDIEGYLVQLRGKNFVFFLPKSREDYKWRLKTARNNEEYDVAKRMDEMCIDLRPSFACTVNKSQGSTFDTVFIDLNNICKKMRSANQLARALYVGVSRARSRVVMSGDM